MIYTESDEKHAVEAALKATEKFDFEFRDVVSVERLQTPETGIVFRVTIRLRDSQQKIEAGLAQSGDAEGSGIIRDMLLGGTLIIIDAIPSGVLGEKWIGIQFS